MFIFNDDKIEFSFVLFDWILVSNIISLLFSGIKVSFFEIWFVKFSGGKEEEKLFLNILSSLLSSFKTWLRNDDNFSFLLSLKDSI